MDIQGLSPKVKALLIPARALDAIIEKIPTQRSSSGCLITLACFGYGLPRDMARGFARRRYPFFA